MVGCEMRSPSDDVHGNKVLTYWYEAIDWDLHLMSVSQEG